MGNANENVDLTAYNVLADLDLPQSMVRLVNWYAEYAEEIVTDRAIISLDGFKPVHRRILYAMRQAKYFDLTKSAKAVGAVLGLHPHGEGSIYDALVRMTDWSEYLNVPLIHGKGSYGKVFSKSPPAAMRYTEAALHENTKLVFDGMEGIKLVLTEDGEEYEPELLPVSVPFVLLNANSGIAVGMASNTPSYNFHEVIDATIDVVKTGTTDKLLVPDFTTKGEYVYDEKELKKIMQTGRGRLKLRGKWYIDGKTIIIEELPYYTTLDAVMKQISKKQIPNISDVRNTTGRKGLTLEVECSNRKVVDTVLSDLLRHTDLQLSMTTNFTVIINNTPRVIGIIELLREWVEFRKGIVKAKVVNRLEGVKTQIPRFELLRDLFSNEEKRDKFMNLLTKQSASIARGFLRETYPQYPAEVASWVTDHKLSSLSGLASKQNKLEELYAERDQLEKDLNNIDTLLIAELQEITRSYSFPRKTAITETDYVFEEEETTKVVKAAPTPTVVVVDGKFVKKIRLNPSTQNVEGLRCMSDDVLSFIDTQGRLLRVNLENLNYVSERDRGVYLPVYLEVEDDFEVVAYELIQDKKVGYVYTDGFVSVVDYSEWVDSKRSTRMTANGVSTFAPMIIGEFDFSKTHLLLFTNERKFGFVETDFKQKHRTARTKLVNVKEGESISEVIPVSYSDMLKLVADPQKYVGKLSLLASGDTFDAEYLNTLI